MGRMTVKKRYIRMTVKKSSPEDAGFTAMEREDAKRLKETKSNAIKVLKLLGSYRLDCLNAHNEYRLAKSKRSKLHLQPLELDIRLCRQAKHRAVVLANEVYIHNKLTFFGLCCAPSNYWDGRPRSLQDEYNYFFPTEILESGRYHVGGAPNCAFSSAANLIVSHLRAIHAPQEGLFSFPGRLRRQMIVEKLIRRMEKSPVLNPAWHQTFKLNTTVADWIDDFKKDFKRFGVGMTMTKNGNRY